MPKTHKSKQTAPENKKPTGHASSSNIGQSSSAVAGPSNESRWKTIRPWKAPDGPADEETASPSDSAILENASGCLKLEVIDVSSTSVALAIVSVPSLSCPPSPLVAAADESQPVAGPSNHAKRRSRSASNASIKTSPASIPAPAISIRLNSVPWPHVLHSDPAFLDHNGQNSKSDGVPSATIVVYNLEPGKEYEVELDVVEQTQKVEEPGRPPTIPSPKVEEPRSKFTTTALEPDGPPPPYSSHDPSSSTTRPALTSSEQSSSSNVSTPSQPSEAQLRATLDEVKTTNKQAEQALHASIAAIKRALEKSTREDLRGRQRISTLEEATRKIKESLAEDAEDLDSFVNELKPLQEEEQEWKARVESCKIRITTADAEGRASMEADEQSLKSLTSELEEMTSREDGLNLEKARLEKEVLPDLNITLANLEAEIRRMDLSMQMHPVQVEYPITRSAVGSFKRQKQAVLQDSYFPPLMNNMSNISRSTSASSRMTNRKRTGSDGSTHRPTSNTSFVPGLFRKNSGATVVSPPEPIEPPPHLDGLGLSSSPPAQTNSGSRFSFRKRSGSSGVTASALSPLTQGQAVEVEEVDKESEKAAKKPWTDQMPSWSKVVGSRKGGSAAAAAE